MAEARCKVRKIRNDRAIRFSVGLRDCLAGNRVIHRCFCKHGLRVSHRLRFCSSCRVVVVAIQNWGRREFWRSRWQGIVLSSSTLNSGRTFRSSHRKQRIDRIDDGDFSRTRFVCGGTSVHVTSEKERCCQARQTHKYLLERTHLQLHGLSTCQSSWTAQIDGSIVEPIHGRWLYPWLSPQKYCTRCSNGTRI